MVPTVTLPAWSSLVTGLAAAPNNAARKQAHHTTLTDQHLTSQIRIVLFRGPRAALSFFSPAPAASLIIIPLRPSAARSPTNCRPQFFAVLFGESLDSLLHVDLHRPPAAAIRSLVLFIRIPSWVTRGDRLLRAPIARRRRTASLADTRLLLRLLVLLPNGRRLRRSRRRRSSFA
jgi:hypothetical protein